MKPRKPRRLLFDAYEGYVECETWNDDRVDIRVNERDTQLTIKQAKKLHAWLGRWIAWMEGKE